MSKRKLMVAVWGCMALSGFVAAQGEVSVYCSLDAEHSQQLLEAFEKKTGIKVRFNMDTEDNKTVGLVNKIISEAANPRCDVFWNNEVANTIRLKNRGLLEPYASPSAADIPPAWKDPKNYWTGFAARARVIIYNKDLVKGEPPKSLKDLLNPQWIKAGTMAKPLTGTTLTHAGALFVAWGELPTKSFLADIARSGLYLNLGNAQVMRDVGEGGRAWGYTDTDDAYVAEVDRKYKTAVVIPDQGPNDPGTLIIPNSVAIIKGARNLDNAKKIVDYILSREVEQALAEGRSAQIPVRADIPSPAHVLKLDKVKAMQVDWDLVAKAIDDHGTWLNDTFGGAVKEPGKKSSSALWVLGGIVILAVLIGASRRRSAN